MDLLTLLAASWLSATEPPQAPIADAQPLQLAQAGGPPRGPGRRHRRPPDPQQLATELGLDPSQSSQFVAILTEQRGKHEALREQMRGEREAARQVHQRIDEETFTRLAGVLSSEQLARFHARRPPPPPQHERRRGPSNRGYGGQS